MLARPNGIPSHDTFRRVFCLLDPEAFQQSFADWVAAMADCGAGALRVIPIDGKTARRSGRRRRGLAPLHLVSAWASANHVSLGQVAVVARRPTGYFVTHLEGPAYPLVNGESIGLSAYALRDNDLIELAGTIIQFSADG